MTFTSFLPFLVVNSKCMKNGKLICWFSTLLSAVCKMKRIARVATFKLEFVTVLTHTEMESSDDSSLAKAGIASKNPVSKIRISTFLLIGAS